MEKVYLSGIVSKTGKGAATAPYSTNHPWFVEYGAVAAPLPVCHPFMPASLSFLLPEDIHIRSAIKKPTFRYGSELLFSRKGSLWAHNT